MLDHSCIKLLLIWRGARRQGKPRWAPLTASAQRPAGRALCRTAMWRQRRMQFPYLGHSPLETFSARSNGMYC